jgi:hypothetical protein
MFTLFLIGFGIIAVSVVPTCLALIRLFRRIRQGIQGKPKVGWYFKTAVFALFILPSLLVLLASIYAVASMGYTSIRNYYGYCTWKKPLRDRRFTTEERLDIAINYYLGAQENRDYEEIGKAEGMEGQISIPFPHETAKQRFTLIPYTGKDEFLRENPDCCQRTWGLAEGEQFGTWERVDGAGDGMFNFRHKVRYLDQQGVRKEIETTNTFIMVNNCGDSRGKFYYGKVIDSSELISNSVRKPQ